MAKKMTIEFKQGKKIIKHPTGVEREYSKEDLEKHKAELLERKQSIDEEITQIDDDLVKIVASKAA